MSKKILLTLILILSNSVLFGQKKGGADTAAVETAGGEPAVSEKAFQLEQIVVTGQFFPQSLDRSVYRVKVITAEQIEQKAPASVESLLNTEIGIRIYNDMALGETQFELMGMSGNNVKVLIDGVPIVERSGNQQILSQIDVNTIERIEIVEGPMSVMYGTDALAGVINIITKKGKSKGGAKLSVTARLQEETVGREYGFMTGKGFHTQGVTAGYAFDNGLYASINFTRNEFGGWHGDRVQRAGEWPSRTQYMGGGQIGFRGRRFDLQYKLDYLNEEILKKGDVSAINRAVDEKFLAERFTHQLHGNWKTGNRVELGFAASYQNYRRDKRNTIIDFVTGERKPSTAANDNDDTEYSIWFARATMLWKTTPDLNLQVGAEYQRNTGKGDKVSGGATAIDNAALFLSAEYTPTEWLSVRPGVRSMYNSEYDAPWAIPSLNLKLALHKTVDLRLSYAQGFRSPTLQELYYEFYHDNGGGFWIRGNKDLKAERSNSFMASLVWRPLHDGNMRLTHTLSGFYNAYKNQIRLVTIDEATIDQMYYNIDKYRTVGLTLENAFAMKNLTAEAAFSYIGRYNRLSDAEEFAARKQEKMRYSPEVSASVSYKWDKVATFNVFYKFTGRRSEYTSYKDDSGDYRLALGRRSGFHWMDLTVSRPVIKMIRITVGVRNLFDVTRIDNTVRDTWHAEMVYSGKALIAYGRSYFLGLTFNLNK